MWLSSISGLKELARGSSAGEVAEECWKLEVAPGIRTVVYLVPVPVPVPGTGMDSPTARSPFLGGSMSGRVLPGLRTGTVFLGTDRAQHAFSNLLVVIFRVIEYCSLSVKSTPYVVYGEKNNTRRSTTVSSTMTILYR
jgi:hypothetical protein